MRKRKTNPNLTPETFKQFRLKKLGWSKYKLAKELGTSQTTIARWEDGSLHPPFVIGLALKWLDYANSKTNEYSSVESFENEPDKASEA